MHEFFIGAATAAHQVEGNNIHSDYWVMENVKHSDFTEPSGVACDHYNRYEEDIRLLAEAGANAYRFGIEWARIEPEELRDTVYGAQAKHPEECTAYLFYSMRIMAEIADEVEPGYAIELRKIAENAKSVYPTYASLDTDRQAKLVRPLALGLLDGEEKKAAQERLKAAVENYRFRVGTGFLSTPFILGVLTEAEESETAYKMLENTEKPG